MSGRFEPTPYRLLGISSPTLREPAPVAFDGGPRCSRKGSVVLALAFLGLVACHRGPTSGGGAGTSSSASAAAQPRPAAPAAEPSILLDTEGSPYAASLANDGDATLVLTSTAVFRLVPGRPADRWGLALGDSPTAGSEHFLYWSEGSFRRVRKHGGEPELLAKVAHTPQRIVAAGDQLVWLDHAENGRFTIRTLDGSGTRVIASPSNYVAAIAAQEDRIYFVERLEQSRWRLGLVSLAGESPRYTAPKSGRTPAMLFVAHDVYYYDGPSRTVRRVSPDLEREEEVASDVICSPLAVADRLYCAQPGGIIELELDGAHRRPIPLRHRGVITAIVATSSRLTWLTDVGPERLVVESLPLGSAAGSGDPG